MTLFPNQGGETGPDVIAHPNPGLAKGGCFAHRARYVRDVAAATGFVVEQLETAIHEHHDENTPIDGYIVALRKPAL